MQTQTELSIIQILEAFNAPVNEEQAWAISYECAIFLNKFKKSIKSEDSKDYSIENTIDLKNVYLGSDGHVSKILHFEDCLDESQAVKSLGLLVFRALDFGLVATEEQELSSELENLISHMTGEGKISEGRTVEGDEGIGDDEAQIFSMNFDNVIQSCDEHVDSNVESNFHYKAVCRALVAEAVELISFLEKIDSEKLENISEKISHPELQTHLQTLHRTDWARLWIQLMRELRQGVQLKKVESSYKNSVEYELTPYEILMDDVRSKRYTLNKVETQRMEGDLSLTIKKDIHEIILDFIRSRPPLHSVDLRGPNKSLDRPMDQREQLMHSIRSHCPNLRSSHQDPVVTIGTKKKIKPDLTLIMSDSLEDDDDIHSKLNRISMTQHTPFTPLTPKCPPSHLPWQHTVLANEGNKSYVNISDAINSSQNTPQFPFTDIDQLLGTGIHMECLALTVEEVMHIRSVLTKAELESFYTNPELQNMLANGKICFCCKRVKFSVFRSWSKKCGFCERFICSKCCHKMQLPTEHFEHVPVYMLSPSPSASFQDSNFFASVTTSGSAPTSPNRKRGSSCHSSSSSTRSPESEYTTNFKPKSQHESRSRIEPEYCAKFSRELSEYDCSVKFESSAESATDLECNTKSITTSYIGNKIEALARSRASLFRSITSAKPKKDEAETSPNRLVFSGPTIIVCRDCRSMVAGIVKAGRRSLALSNNRQDRAHSACPVKRNRLQKALTVNSRGL